jgi:hypothetical protein
MRVEIDSATWQEVCHLAHRCPTSWPIRLGRDSACAAKPVALSQDDNALSLVFVFKMLIFEQTALTILSI